MRKLELKNKFNNLTTLESGRNTFARFEPVVMRFLPKLIENNFYFLLDIV